MIDTGFQEVLCMLRYSIYNLFADVHCQENDSEHLNIFGKIQV